MSILRGLGKLTGAAIRTVVVLPVAAARDVVTCFGAVDDSGSAILRQARKIARETDEGIHQMGEE